MSSIHDAITVGGCIRLFDEVVVVSRAIAPPQVVDGRKVQEATRSDFEINASVQPMTQEQSQSLEAGIRNRGAVRVYTTDELRTTSVFTAKLADTFVWLGTKYRVHTEDADWSTVGGYRKYIATRVNR